MIEQFLDPARLFPQAFASGIVMTVTCSVLGVFVVLKRVVFISIALSETAACGIAAAMMLQVHPMAGAVCLTALVVLFLSINYENGRIPRDAVLGVVFLLASSLSILLVSKSGFGLQEIKAMLYGDLILTSREDLKTLLLVSIPAILLFLLFLRPITFTFLDREVSQVMGLACRVWEIGFFLLLGLVVSAASKSGGVLLVFCYLVVIPATALLLTRSLALVLIVSPCLGIFTTMGGLTLSYREDLPCNQTIILISCISFGVVLAFLEILKRFPTLQFTRRHK